MNKTKSGFTIVELLIVIVVIGILAAITVVAYNGIVSRANTSSAQSLANSVVKKVEAYNVIHGQYPAFLELANNRLPGTTTPNNAAAPEARLESPSNVSTGSPNDTNGTRVVLYYTCGSTGAYVVYRNYITSSNTPIMVGSC